MPLSRPLGSTPTSAVPGIHSAVPGLHSAVPGIHSAVPDPPTPSRPPSAVTGTFHQCTIGWSETDVSGRKRPPNLQTITDVINWSAPGASR